MESKYSQQLLRCCGRLLQTKNLDLVPLWVAHVFFPSSSPPHFIVRHDGTPLLIDGHITRDDQMMMIYLEANVIPLWNITKQEKWRQAFYEERIGEWETFSDILRRDPAVKRLDDDRKRTEQTEATELEAQAVEKLAVQIFEQEFLNGIAAASDTAIKKPVNGDDKILTAAWELAEKRAANLLGMYQDDEEEYSSDSE